MKPDRDVPILGVGSNWPSRRSLLEWLSNVTPWSMEQAVAYNSRNDLKNVRNIPPLTSYYPVGVRMNFKAQILALKCEPWEQAMRDAIGYLMFGDQLNYFWHGQFRKLFPDHPQALRTMDWELMTQVMATAFVLGRIDEGIYQGYLVHATLNQTYQLQLSYEDKHRCGLVFMLRLFADWRRNVSHHWPKYAYDEPIYEAILQQWREPDPEVLKPWLLAACDRHTHQSQADTESSFYDFSSFPRMPLEILFLLKLREMTGLQNPRLEHPLMEAPFDRLPPEQLAYAPDELMLGTMARVRMDWSEYDDAISLTTILMFASQKLQSAA